MNVIEAKSPHKTWNNWRQRSRLWYKQENPHSAKRCGEEESALNDRREKIRQCRKKETSELGKVWPILYLTIQFFFSFLLFFIVYFILRQHTRLVTIIFQSTYGQTRHMPLKTSSTDMLCFAVFLRQGEGVHYSNQARWHSTCGRVFFFFFNI